MTPDPHSPEAFESLLDPVLAPAYRYALSLTRNQADAEDLVQEAALKAFRGFRTFTPGTNFRAWFYRILANSWYGRKRKESRRPTEVDVDDAGPLHLFVQARETGLIDGEVHPARQLLAKLDIEAVTRAIEALPDEFREVAALYFMEEFAYQEIAEVLDLPIGTVRSRLHRARRILQQNLWTVAEDMGLVPTTSTGPATTGEESR